MQNLTQKFLPCQNLHLSWCEQPGEFELSVPWMSIRVETDPENIGVIYEAIEALKNQNNDNTKNINYDEKISTFLSNFSDYPIAYRLPREFEKFSETTPAVKFETLDSPKAMLMKMLSEIQSLKDFETNSMLTMLPDSWQWDEKPMFELATIPNTDLVDPLSCYSFIQIKRLQHENLFSRLGETFKKLKERVSQNETKIFNAIGLMLTQTKYVTAQCVPSLEPGLKHDNEFSIRLEDFIQQEKGHDRLIDRSLSALELTEETVVLPATIASMALLKFSALSSALSLAVAIEAFESGTHRDEDPIGSLLRKTSRPQAAWGVDTHFAINRNHGHAQVGETLAETLSPVDPSEALFALRTSELLSHLAAAMEQQLEERLVTMRVLP